jgi:hypothetical protein
MIESDVELRNRLVGVTYDSYIERHFRSSKIMELRNRLVGATYDSYIERHLGV